MSDINMEAKIHAHIDRLFQSAPINERVSEIKLEIYMNTVDRYHDLLKDGKEPAVAYQEAVNTIGDLDELLRSIDATVPGTVSPPAAPGISDKKKRRRMRRKLLREHIGTILWMTMLTLYFLISFATSAWHVTWIMFLLTVALQNIIHAAMDCAHANKPDIPYFPTREQKAILSTIHGALWMLIFAAYFIVSFTTMAWYITWVIFLVGVALESLISIIMMYSVRPSLDTPLGEKGDMQ